MAVYTRLDANEIELWAKRFGLGKVDGYRGIALGTVNTIYRVDTHKARFVLRLLEDRSRRDADFEADLVEYLRRSADLKPCIAGMRRWRNSCVHTRRARQHVSVFTWLQGRSLPKAKIVSAHVEQVGQVLGSMHRAQRGFRRRRRCAYDPDRMRTMLSADWPKLGGLERETLHHVRHTLSKSSWEGLGPDAAWGVVHGDLFIDNVHFQRGKLKGVLDFEMASLGPLLFDVAVAICEWAFADNGRFFPAYAQALLRGYGGVGRKGRTRLYDLCLFAAARFTWTRIHDFVLSEREVDIRAPKSYKHFLSRHQKLRELGRAKFVQALG